MNKLLITPRAEQDLEEIYLHTFSTWGIKQADRYQDELYHAMQLILKDHDLGRRYPHSSFEYRQLHINRHLIFYRIEENHCIVIRILHDRMNLRSHL